MCGISKACISMSKSTSRLVSLSMTESLRMAVCRAMASINRKAGFAFHCGIVSQPPPCGYISVFFEHIFSSDFNTLSMRVTVNLISNVAKKWINYSAHMQRNRQKDSVRYLNTLFSSIGVLLLIKVNMCP